MPNISLDYKDCSTDSFSSFKYFCFDKNYAKSEAVFLRKYTDGDIHLHFIGLDEVSYIERKLPLDIYNQIIALGDDVLQVFDLVKAFFQIPPTTTTDTKSESCVIAETVGAVDSEGDALFVVDCSHCGMQLGVTETPAKPMLCDDCLHDATAFGRVDKICKDCGCPDDYCICETCADCGVITKLVGCGTQCPECYQLSRQPIFKMFSPIKKYDPQVSPVIDDDIPDFGLGV